jgi:hypothetical protein
MFETINNSSDLQNYNYNYGMTEGPPCNDKFSSGSGMEMNN